MISITKILFSDRNTPRWIVFLIDIFICFLSVIIAYLLRFDFNIPQSDLILLPFVIPFIIFVRALSFVVGRTYSSIVRYTSSKDAELIFIVVSCGTAFFVISNIIVFNTSFQIYLIPRTIIIIDYLLTIFGMIVSRIVVKHLFLEYYNPQTKIKSEVIIFGAGKSGIITKRTLDRDAGIKYKVLAFIDEDSQKIGKKLEGIPICGYYDLEPLLMKNTVAHVIISIQHIDGEKKKKIIELCMQHNTKVLNVPPINRWINGELSFKQIKKIKIEDILERKSIELDKQKIKKDILGKTILITGAAGSIGSEIVRQIANYLPKKIIMLDQAETPLYYIEIEIRQNFPDLDIEPVIGSVYNEARMRNLFNTYNPEVVFHAAAYKHVPMMEENPSEAVITNIKGTKIMADLSVEFNVEKFVMISTDKAVNPTNVMGASKRIAEIYVQSLSSKSTVKFMTSRFGNVLGTNGSVIPLFDKQIQDGGPVTVTHPDVTRYFMTIVEACQLVLEASTMGNGGEIFILDMGTPVKIVDVAKKMIKLSGLSLGKDIQIKYTGLRPGEKLYEELLTAHENTIPTYHKQIMIAKVKESDFETVSKEINELSNMFDKQNNIEIVSKMKILVPEFKSQNSIYEKLDLNN